MSLVNVEAFLASVTLAENDDSSAWNFEDLQDLLICAIFFLQLRGW